MGADGGGCTDCGKKGGCDTRKGGMFAAIADTLDRLYPTRRWDARDEEQAFRAGVSPGEAAQLAQTLAARLSALALFRPGSDHEYCDYVYVLCVGRSPSVIEIREGVGDAESLGVQTLGTVEELYLRVALSSVARVAGVQQVTLRLEPVAGDGGGWTITEMPRTGVFDPILLKRFQALVGVLSEMEIRHLDFGEILEPPQGFDPGDYDQRYGGAPAIANYLFYPQPCSAVTTTVVEAPAPAAVAST